MSEPLVVVDADVLGRRRTGDETYVERLLHELPAQAEGFRLAAVTRRPELLPAESSRSHWTRAARSCGCSSRSRA